MFIVSLDVVRHFIIIVHWWLFFTQGQVLRQRWQHLQYKQSHYIHLSVHTDLTGAGEYPVKCCRMASLTSTISACSAHFLPVVHHWVTCSPVHNHFYIYIYKYVSEQTTTQLKQNVILLITGKWITYCVCNMHVNNIPLPDIYQSFPGFISLFFNLFKKPLQLFKYVISFFIL